MQKTKSSQCWPLFLSFLKIGAFTFGGGYAMIPLIQKEAVSGHGWITDEDILEITAIAESTPGPIAINAATFVGYRVCGVPGAMLATFGVVLPSFLIILAISGVLRAFSDNQIIQYAFSGIRAGVLALICKALWSMFRQCPHNLFSYLAAAGAFLAVAVFGVSVLPVIVCCAAAGLIRALAEMKKSGKENR